MLENARLDAVLAAADGDCFAAYIMKQGGVLVPRKLRSLFPKTAIRIRKGSANGIELSGVKQAEDKERVMEILQQVWEDDSWLH